MTERAPYPYELATPEQLAIGALWWCNHHQVMLEPLTGPIENRVAYIMKYKPEHERETRLRALRPFVGVLPGVFATIYATRQKAYEDWQKAYEDWRKAYEDWRKADADRRTADDDWRRDDATWRTADADWRRDDAAHAPEIDALFAVQCPDVAWGPDGLVFPEVTR